MGTPKPCFCLARISWRQEPAERALEEIPLLEAAHLELGRQRAGELDQRPVEEGEPHLDAAQLGRPGDLEEVVVPDRELEIQVHQPVELGRGLDAGEVLLEHAPGPARGRLPEEGRLEHLGRVLGHVKLVGVEPSRVRDVRPADVALGPAEETGHAGGQAEQHRLEQAAAERGGQARVAGEDAIGAVPLVAAEDLVAPVPGQEPGDPVLAGHARAEVDADGGVVAEGLVVRLHEPRQRVQRVVGLDDARVVGGVEGPRGQLRVLQLVVAVLVEADREGADRPARDARHQADHGAAVGSAAQEGADLARVRLGQCLADRLVAQAVHGGGRPILPVALLRVAHVPVGLELAVALADVEHVPGRQAPDTGEGRLGRRNEAEVQVAEDRGRLDGRRLGEAGPQCGQARREGGAAGIGRVVQAPHPEGVHGQEQGALPPVPQGHREGAPQPPEERGPLHLVQAREQAGLGLRLVEAGDRAQLFQVEQVRLRGHPDRRRCARSGPGRRRTGRPDRPRCRWRRAPGSRARPSPGGPRP